MINDDDKIILDASIINTEVLGSQHLVCDKSDYWLAKVDEFWSFCMELINKNTLFFSDLLDLLGWRGPIESHWFKKYWPSWLHIFLNTWIIIFS